MRKVGVALVAAAAVAAAAAVFTLGQPAARAQDAGSMRATMTCERVDGPGRVRCDVEARVGAGESITWGDVVLLKAPAFVGVLRGRIGPHDATTRDADLWRWALALVAREKGSGEIEGRVRLVVCRDGKCAPREVPLVGRVQVGE